MARYLSSALLGVFARRGQALVGRSLLLAVPEIVYRRVAVRPVCVCVRERERERERERVCVREREREIERVLY